jgi:hypothetical protein
MWHSSSFSIDQLQLDIEAVLESLVLLLLAIKCRHIYGWFSYHWYWYQDPTLSDDVCAGLEMFARAKTL